MTSTIVYIFLNFEKEKRYDIEILSIDRVLNKDDFYGKIMHKMCYNS